jgi:NAD+ synthase
MENNMNYLKNKITDWIKNYAIKNNLDALIIGVSGGIDSAVVSTLCARTGLKTIVLNLPINSKESNTDLSSLHCSWLCKTFDNVKTRQIDMTPAFDSFQDTMTAHNYCNSLAAANSKSRLRMMSLYHIATCNNGLVVGTGNKVEDFGVGFYTKYGDGGVDISPIADLTKTQVRKLAAELQINNKIIEAPPTDGLWEDYRTDEEQIGASYEELEWAMEHLSNNINIDLTSRQKEVINIYNKFHNKNRHKMTSIPVFNASKF